MRVSGLILIDKPLGITSRTVTTRVSKICAEKQAGHLGTLDPLASGLLPILIGPATRLGSFLEADRKIYLATVKLGIVTDTMDGEGQVVSTREVPALTEEKIQEALGALRGEIMQVPPKYSAIQHEGRRSYQLAREGKEVAVEPRKVTIESLTLQSFTATELTVEVVCSPGTYIRSLANDIGESLGCGAYLSALRRTASGKFKVEQAVPLDNLTPENCSQYLIAMEELVEFPKIELADDHGYRVSFGGKVPLPEGLSFPAGAMVRVFSKPCFAIAEVVYEEERPVLRPVKVFSKLDGNL